MSLLFGGRPHYPSDDDLRQRRAALQAEVVRDREARSARVMRTRAAASRPAAPPSPPVTPHRTDGLTAAEAAEVAAILGTIPGQAKASARLMRGERVLGQAEDSAPAELTTGERAEVGRILATVPDRNRKPKALEPIEDTPGVGIPA